MLDEIIKRVDYDVRDNLHRTHLYNFIDTGKWGQHFVVPKNCTNLPYHLMVETLKYFAACERKEANTLKALV